MTTTAIETKTIQATQVQLAVMQAFVAGEKIESRPKDSLQDPWICISFPSWNWLDNDYRVAQPPKRQRSTYQVSLLITCEHEPLSPSYDRNLLTSQIADLLNNSLYTKYTWYHKESTNVLTTKFSDLGICFIAQNPAN